MDRNKVARKQGYETPFSKSPVETPTGWVGGSLEAIGGGTLCRIWRNEEHGLRVIYDASQDDRVALEELSEDNKVYNEVHSVESSGSDRHQAEVAYVLMQDYKNYV